MKKITKRIIISGSLILLVSGASVSSIVSVADVVTTTPEFGSTPPNSFADQSPPAYQITSSFSADEFTLSRDDSISQKNNAESSSDQVFNNELDPQTVALNDNEDLDSWMPNSDLQLFISYKLGVDKSQITKDLLGSKTLLVSYEELDRPFFNFSSYEGLEYFSNISIIISASSEGESLDFLRLHPINWEGIRKFSNVFISVDGDLTAIFPNGIDLNDSRINIDPHNIYFMNDINLNQNNFKSFFLSYSELKLLNVDPSVFNHITDLNFGEGSYKATPEANGLLFELTNNIDYSLLAGKSYLNTNEYLSFPDGPYIQLSTGSKNINSRINLHYNLLGANVTVKYVDTKDNAISDEVVKSGNVGDSYTTEQKNIEGYTFKEVQGNVTGTFTDQAQTVTYVYTKKPVLGAAITVKYVDTKGNVISDEAIKSGNVGDSYTTEQKNIEGYTFKEVQGNVTGTFTDQAQTVTYVYTKKPVLGAAVTVKYVDTKGNVISDEAIKSGNVGDSYTTEQKNIEGYTFKEVQGNSTGTFTDQAQTITYVYTKNVLSELNLTPSSNSKTQFVSSKEQIKILPQTGDNSTFTVVVSILGSLLLCVGLVLSLLRTGKTK